MNQTNSLLVWFMKALKSFSCPELCSRYIFNFFGEYSSHITNQWTSLFLCNGYCVNRQLFKNGFYYHNECDHNYYHHHSLIQKAIKHIKIYQIEIYHNISLKEQSYYFLYQTWDLGLVWHYATLYSSIKSCLCLGSTKKYINPITH